MSDLTPAIFPAARLKKNGRATFLVAAAAAANQAAR
jgi:hypothetical protein